MSVGERQRRWDECSGDPCICPKPVRTLVHLHDRERASLAYALLGDRTSQPDGSEWDHDRLRRLVNDLLEVI